jgi:hypothetical protein
VKKDLGFIQFHSVLRFLLFPSLRMFLIIKVEPIVDTAPEVNMSSRTFTVYDRTVTSNRTCECCYHPSEAKITVCRNVIPIVATKVTKISRKDRNFPSPKYIVSFQELVLMRISSPLATSRPAGLTLSNSSKCLP